jgi:hypothetical protein
MFISVKFLSGNLLNGEYNEKATAEAFRTALIEKIETAYPDADVTVKYEIAEGVSPKVESDNASAAAHVERMMEELYDEQENWAVA